jgi:hypothetical protein
MKGANNMPKKSSDAHIRASAKYNKENVKRVILHFNITTDKDILDCLSRKDNKTGYIKDLIRDDITKENKAKNNPRN